MAASKMSCNCGRCSSSLTAACQVLGVIDLLLEQQNTRRRRRRKSKTCKTATLPFLKLGDEPEMSKCRKLQIADRRQWSTVAVMPLNRDVCILC